MSTCTICGYMIPPVGVPWGYAGPTCLGHNPPAPPAAMPYRGDPFRFSTAEPVFWPAPLTADDVRRIVRDELEKVLK